MHCGVKVSDFLCNAIDMNTVFDIVTFTSQKYEPYEYILHVSIAICIISNHLSVLIALCVFKLTINILIKEEFL